MTRLEDALRGVTRVGVDTMTVIYFVGENPAYLPVVDAVFQRISTGELTGAASTITLTEVLIQPLRHGDVPLADQYRELLTHSENFEMYPLDVDVSERAADLRARYNLRTADAIVVATALEAGCEAIVTNDDRIPRVTELRVILLDDTEL